MYISIYSLISNVFDCANASKLEGLPLSSYLYKLEFTPWVMVVVVEEIKIRFGARRDTPRAQ